MNKKQLGLESSLGLCLTLSFSIVTSKLQGLLFDFLLYEKTRYFVNDADKYLHLVIITIEKLPISGQGRVVG